MISVAMTTFNSERFIIEQFESIRNQSVQVDEVIIVDDCSTDQTVSIVKQYIRQYQLNNWSLFLHDKNEGFIKTFSDAIGKTKGDVIILSDHDDIWLEDKVANINAAFDKNKDILALATSFVKIDENGQEVPERKSFTTSNNGLIRYRVRHSIEKIRLRDCLAYNISPGCTCAFSSSLKKEFLGTSSLQNLPHDWKINVLAACLDGLYYLDVVTTKYRLYAGNTYGLGHKLQYSERLNICAKDLEQKKDIEKIIFRFGNDSARYDVKKIINIYTRRLIYMSERKSLGFLLKTLGESFYFTGLWKSIIFDMISCVHFKKGM